MLENKVKGKMIVVVSLMLKNEIKMNEIKIWVMVFNKKEVVKRCW